MNTKISRPQVFVVFSLVLFVVILSLSVFWDSNRDTFGNSNDKNIDNCKNDIEPWRILYGNYVRQHSDLLAAYKTSGDNQSIERWGRSHYDKFGKYEKRDLSISFRELASQIPDFFLLDFVDKPSSRDMLGGADTILSNDGLELNYFQTSICELIKIWNPKDVSLLREKLIGFIWGDSGLPTAVPGTVTKDFKIDKRWKYRSKSYVPLVGYSYQWASYNELENLLRIDKLTVEMEFGLRSNVYHFLPKSANGMAVLFHQGHGGDFHKSKKLIEEFLRVGYSVVAFSMPLLGLNNRPTVYLPKFGYLQFNTHDKLQYLNPNEGHPIKYFLEPVVQVLNYLEKQFDYGWFSMVGISGGGWTTTMVSALDTRVRLSFPVAGTVPIFLRHPDDGIDWEQSVVSFENISNNLELYVLGAYGSGRKQLQIANYDDPCCFGGRRMSLYKDVVRLRVSKLGAGEFDMYIDTTHDEHVVSNVAIALIDQEITATKNNK
jgi:hypothetical protein